MIEIKTKLRKWGNSFRIVIPQKIIKQKRLKEGDEITILITKEKSNVLRETFGTHKFKKSTAKLMREMDKELYDV